MGMRKDGEEIEEGWGGVCEEGMGYSYLHCLHCIHMYMLVKASSAELHVYTHVTLHYWPLEE